VYVLTLLFSRLLSDQKDEDFVFCRGLKQFISRGTTERLEIFDGSGIRRQDLKGTSPWNTVERFFGAQDGERAVEAFSVYDMIGHMDSLAARTFKSM
jgi:hypothetical protein